MELEIGGIQYVTRKLKSKQQRNVARRLAPLLLSAKGLLQKMFGNQEEGTVDELFAALQPLAKALSTMTDEDSDYVFDTCLACVSRQVTGGWQAILAGGELRYEDIGLPDQIKLTLAVIKDSMGDFTSALPGNSADSPS